jgi:arginine metabolism regulation protein II
MYGITITIANAIQETCRLAEVITRIEERQSEDLPEWLRQACEDLGDLLLSWTLDEAEVNSITDEEMRAIFKHHAHAWHHAALIYYYRRVQNVPTSELSEEASIVAEHMHAVETLKATSRSEQASRMAPITWPAFIASCDATNRDVWMDWWERVKHYKIANIPRQCDVVKELWERIDEKTQSGDGYIDWIMVYKELDITLLPI